MKNITLELIVNILYNNIKDIFYGGNDSVGIDLNKDISFLEMDVEDIDKLYELSSDKQDIFYLILNQYYNVKEVATNGQIAHLCHLMSYLLINKIKPINKNEIALIFAEKSYGYMKVDKYKEWLDYLNTMN